MGNPVGAGNELEKAERWMVNRMRAASSAARKLSSQLMVALLVVALVGFLGLFLWQSLQIQKMQGDYEKKKAEIDQLKDRNAGLQEHLDFYKGPGYLLYVEKVAREALGLVKPGETLVLPVPDTGVAGSPAGAQSGPAMANAPPTDNKKKPNWQNWLDFFFGQ